MDDIFARCVDVIALSGKTGIECTECISRVADLKRPALVRWLYRQCKAREPHFFTVKGEDFTTAIVVGSKPLRERALGYSPLEHAALQPQAWAILEAVGKVGKHGVLQSQLSKDLDIGPVKLHHYLGSLLALKLVVRRRIVLSGQKKESSKGSSKVGNNVTQTCVIALARYAASIGSCTAKAIPDPDANETGENNDKTVVHNLDLEARTQKILLLLNNAPGGIMPERDIKVQVIPEAVERNRHRSFRTVRDKIAKAQLVKKVVRRCVDVHGNPRGNLPCLMLIRGDEGNAIADDDTHQVITGEAYADEEDADDPPQEIDGQDTYGVDPETGGRAEMLEEVDIAEQVYRAFDKSRSRGISCPEIVSMLDGGTGKTGIEYKRMRSLLNSMETSHGLKPMQHFNASACHKRFVLKEHHKKSGDDWLPEDRNSDKRTVTPMSSAVKSKSLGRGRTVAGNLTTLGTRRRAILESVLERDKIIVSEKIGRIISEAEGNNGHVDVKVSRKIVKTMIDDGICRTVSVAKPRFGSGKERGSIQLLVATGVEQGGREMRDFITKLFKKTLYTTSESKPLSTPNSASRKRSRTSLKRKALETLDETDADPVQVHTRKRRTSSSNPSNGYPSQMMSPPTMQSSPPAVVPEAVHTVAPLPLENNPEPTESRIVVRNPARGTSNLRKYRLARLRSSDYGFIAPRMRRARILHEYLIRFVMDERFIESDVPTTQNTMEFAGSVEDLGSFDFDEALKSISVGLFANLFGITEDYGQLSLELIKTPMKLASTIREEVQGRYAQDQSRLLFAILWDLGLVYSENNTKAYLRGAGVFRDFGRGLPLGSSVHCIPFTSLNAVKVYWNELESLCNPPSILETYVRDEKSSAVFANEVLKVPPKPSSSNSGSGSNDSAAPEQLHIYLVASWIAPKRGSLSTLVEDEFIMEMVLQNILVGWDDDGRMPKDISTWILGPIRWIPVEVLFDHRVLLDKGYRRRRKRAVQICDVEYLVQYSRKRIECDVSAAVLRLSKKPNNNISDHKWLNKLNPEKIAHPKKKRVRTQLGTKSPKKSKASPPTELVENVTDVSADARAMKEKTRTSLLNLYDSVFLLAQTVKLNALVMYWKKYNPSLLESTVKDVAWEVISQRVNRSKEEIMSAVDELRENNIVSRYLVTVEDCLCRQLSILAPGCDGDFQFADVPENMVDSYGDATSLRDILYAILNDSSLKFDKITSDTRPPTLSRRKNILRRLRSFMSGNTPTAVVPNPVLVSKHVTRKARIRQLNALDKHDDVHFGLLRVKNLPGTWVKPSSARKHGRAERLRCLLTDIVVSLLSEPEETFDLYTSLFFLSRCSSEDLYEIRNEMYEQKRISIEEKSKRLFKLDTGLKRPEGPCSAEAYQVAAGMRTTLESTSWVDNSLLARSIVNQALDVNNCVASQGTLMAITQSIFFPKSDFRVDVSYKGSDSSLNVSFQGNCAGNTNDAQSAQTPGSIQGADVLRVIDNDVTISVVPMAIKEVGDEDLNRIDSEWLKEVNAKRLREQSTAAFFESQEDKTSAKILTWILEARENGLTSIEIYRLSIRHKITSDRVVSSIRELLTEGVIHRFGYGNGQKDGHRASALYMTASYAWIYVVAPVIEDSTSTFALDWSRARPLSTWTNINGVFNTSLVRSAQTHVMNAVTRRPEIDEKSLVAFVLAREPTLTERAILDTLCAMLKARLLTRTVRHCSGPQFNIFNQTVPATVSETDITLYPDGLELSGIGHKYISRYSAANALHIRRDRPCNALLSGESLEGVALI